MYRSCASCTDRGRLAASLARRNLLLTWPWVKQPRSFVKQLKPGGPEGKHAGPRLVFFNVSHHIPTSLAHLKRVGSGQHAEGQDACGTHEERIRLQAVKESQVPEEAQGWRPWPNYTAELNGRSMGCWAKQEAWAAWPPAKRCPWRAKWLVPWTVDNSSNDVLDGAPAEKRAVLSFMTLCVSTSDCFRLCPFGGWIAAYSR